MRKRKPDEPDSIVTRVRSVPVSNSIKHLQTWLRECLYSLVEGDDGTQRFCRVVARQLIRGNRRGEEAFSIDVPKDATEEWCDNIAIEIHAKLQNEVSNLGGMQKYALYAYHSGDLDNHTTRYIIRLHGSEDDDDELSSEAPDRTGLVAQSMRHTEASNKTLVALVQSLVGTYQSTISRLAAMNEKLLDDKLQFIELIQELQQDKDTREAQAMHAKAKAKGVEQLMDRLGILLPAAVNKITGKPIFAVEDSSLMMMVRSLFTSMAANPERLQKILDTLSPEEAIAFMNLYEQISLKENQTSLAEKKS